MKNSNCICIIAIMALVLSSCGSLSISQKRYSRGLNIDWFAAKEDKGAAQKQSTSKSKRTENIIAAEAPAQLDEPVMGGIKTESYVASSVVASKSVAPVSVKTSGVKAGKEVRTKILSVWGKLEYEQISSSAQSELLNVVEKIVTTNEIKFVEYLNNARPLTPRIHALELIPGIGKTYMKTMLEEREKKKFESYADLKDRVGFKDPVKHISERILHEISGESRMNLFVKR